MVFDSGIDLFLASPERWLWSLAVLPIIGFYLIRTRTRRVRVSQLSFWSEILPGPRKGVWGRLPKRWLSLFAQLLILGLIIGALLEPRSQSAGRQPRQVIVVVDNSASMQSRAGGGNRLRLAVQRAEEILNSLKEEDRVAIIAAAQTAEIVCGFTEFVTIARDSLRAIQPTAMPLDYDQALKVAGSLSREPQSDEIFFITDGCFDCEHATQWQASKSVSVSIVGTPQPNLAITRFQTRRDPLEPAGYQTSVEVAAFSSESFPLSARLRIEREGSLVDVFPLRLSPGETWRKELAGISAAGGVWRAALEIEDALSLDNQAFAVLPPRSTRRVLLVSDQPSSYLLQAFEALPLVEVTTTTIPQAGTEAAWEVGDAGDGQESTFDLTVFHRVVPAILPPGSVLVIDPAEDGCCWRLGRSVADARLQTARSRVTWSGDETHPVVRNVNFGDLVFPVLSTLQADWRATPLIETLDGQPTVLLVPRNLDVLQAGGERVRGRQAERLTARPVIVWTMPIGQGVLPFRTAFPLLIANIVDWISRDDQAWQPAIATGTVFSGKVWSEIGVFAQRSESEMQNAFPLGSARQPVADRRLGSANPAASPSVAVNLTNASESNLAAAKSIPTNARSEPRPGFRPLWWILIWCGVGLLLLEWYCFQRRIVS